MMNKAKLIKKGIMMVWSDSGILFVRYIDYEDLDESENSEEDSSGSGEEEEETFEKDSENIHQSKTIF